MTSSIKFPESIVDQSAYPVSIVGFNQSDPRYVMREQACRLFLHRLTREETLVEVRGKIAVDIDVDVKFWRLAKVSIAPSLRYVFLIPHGGLGKGGTTGRAHSRLLWRERPVTLIHDYWRALIVCAMANGDSLTIRDVAVGEP